MFFRDLIYKAQPIPMESNTKSPRPVTTLLTGNGGLSGEGLIKNSVVFTLGGFSGDPSVNIIDAYFQYGTASTEPGFPSDPNIPEPGSLTLLVLGGIGVAAYGARRRRASARG